MVDKIVKFRIFFKPLSLLCQCIQQTQNVSGGYISNRIRIFRSKRTPFFHMIILLSMSACYCVLTERKIGEICFLVFNHMFLFHEELACRMACVSTVSSGGNKRPTMHRLLLSRVALDIEETDSEDSKFLRGQFMLNTSDILIEKAAYDKMKKEEKAFAERNEIKELLDEIENCWDSMEIRQIDEARISNADCEMEDKIKLISLLRSYSMSDKYNKISTKTDEYIYNYMERKLFPARK